MKITVFTFLFSLFNGMDPQMYDRKLQPPSAALINLSQEFLLAVKTGEPATPFISALKNTTAVEIVSQLNTDELKKAFWINLYNAYTQVILTKDSGEYKNRARFFGSKQIAIAGKSISLDDIEHGILRRSKIKWSLGYLNKLFPSKFEKNARVDVVDYRLHFALNCGAKSCPPIAFYDPAKLNGQLTLATKAYLGSEAEYDGVRNSVTLPAIMGWFRGDFGGKKKMISLLKELAIVPKDKKPKIVFDKYNWNLFLENYKTEQ